MIATTIVQLNLQLIAMFLLEKNISGIVSHFRKLEIKLSIMVKKIVIVIKKMALLSIQKCQYENCISRFLK